MRTDEAGFLELPKEWELATRDAKLALQDEWDKHLRSMHPSQWEREQKKRARRRAARERVAGGQIRKRGQ